MTEYCVVKSPQELDKEDCERIRHLANAICEKVMDKIREQRYEKRIKTVNYIISTDDLFFMEAVPHVVSAFTDKGYDVIVTNNTHCAGVSMHFSW